MGSLTRDESRGIMKFDTPSWGMVGSTRPVGVFQFLRPKGFSTLPNQREGSLAGRGRPRRRWLPLVADVGRQAKM